MALATFLPFNEPNGLFRTIEHNTLIQHGGWTFIALAIGIATAAIRSSQSKRNWFAAAIILCVLAGLQVFFLATDKDSRTLYPVGLDGTLDTTKPTVAPLGIALYVAGFGVAIALFGSFMLRRPDTERPEDDFPAAAWAAEEKPKTKKCPDCAEMVLADAKVCKHCGYRFATTMTKCPKCQHVQSVLQDQSEFECEECRSRLRRRNATAEGG